MLIEVNFGIPESQQYITSRGIHIYSIGTFQSINILCETTVPKFVRATTLSQQISFCDISPQRRREHPPVRNISESEVLQNCRPFQPKVDWAPHPKHLSLPPLAPAIATAAPIPRPPVRGINCHSSAYFVPVYASWLLETPPLIADPLSSQPTTLHCPSQKMRVHFS